MNRLLSRILLPFALALPAGFVAGGMLLEKEVPVRRLPARVAVREPGATSRGTAPDLDVLLARFETDERIRHESDADPFVDHVGEWTGEELEAALTEALHLPRCVDELGRDHHLVFRLHRAWMRKNPDEAAAWVDTVLSAEVREELFRSACQNWPAERAMEGIDYLLAHHWRAGDHHSHRLLKHALESQAADGSAAVDRLLRRLADARVEVEVESLDFPAGFDFPAMAGGDGFGAQESKHFKDLVFTEWRSRNPGSMLEWMQRSATWEPFHDYLAAGSPEAARFLDGAEAEERNAAVEKVRWREVNREQVARFVDEVKDPEAKTALVTKYFRSGTSDDPVAVLELISTAQARVEVLRSLHPELDLRPDASPAAGDPIWAPAIREAVGGWNVAIPARAPDPFEAR